MILENKAKQISTGLGLKTLGKRELFELKRE